MAGKETSKNVIYPQSSFRLIPEEFLEHQLHQSWSYL